MIMKIEKSLREIEERLGGQVRELMIENSRLRTAIAESELRRVEQINHLLEDMRAARKIADREVGAGVFVKRDKIKPEMGTTTPLDLGVEVAIDWSPAACASGLVTSKLYTFSSDWLRMMPDRVRANNWHHLCSIIGATEAFARAFYDHPESDQPSAVAQVRGVGE